MVLKKPVLPMNNHQPSGKSPTATASRLLKSRLRAVGNRRGAFTLIELFVVILILSVLVGVLLPTFASVKKRAISRSLGAASSGPAPVEAPVIRAGGLEITPARPLATVRSFSATVALKPALSVGTADPESIYTARLKAQFQAVNPGAATGGACEVLLPLPPQIISLADLDITVAGQPSTSVEIRGDKLVWFGTLPAEPVPMTIGYSAAGKGLYKLPSPPAGILDTFHIELTAVGSDVRMLELSLQPTKYGRENGQTVYTWDYTHLLFGRPIALDVLGVAPIDRLGELSWLGPGSVVVFGLLLGLLGHAFPIRDFDRWMLLLLLGAFTGAYPLMYFAQEFVSLEAAIVGSATIVLMIIAVRAATVMGMRVAIFGVVLPAAAILAVTLVSAVHPRLQGVLITSTALASFVAAMALMPRRGGGVME